MRYAEKERKKKFSPRIPFTLDDGKKIPKKIEKIQKIKKPHSGIIFSQNGIW